MPPPLFCATQRREVTDGGYDPKVARLAQAAINSIPQMGYGICEGFAPGGGLEWTRFSKVSVRRTKPAKVCGQRQEPRLLLG